jgi:hypothetical protein
MAKRFQYQVCYVVFDHVTLVNGLWQGPNIPESERRQEHVEACPMVWDYLQRAGVEEWKLVGVLESRHDLPKGAQFVRTLYLKREIA